MVVAVPAAGTVMTSGDTVNSTGVGAVQVTVPLVPPGLLNVMIDVNGADPTVYGGNAMLPPLPGTDVIGAPAPSTKLNVSMPM